MSNPVRTRFAPSPTGYLHVGGARTALYAWAYAKRHRGTFVLRVEDTDRERSTQQSIDAILDGMAWLGLAADEGPFYQTQRFDRYKAVIEQLLASGHAYRCYCSKERLQQLRETQQANKEKPRYDGCCRELTEVKDEPYVVRFKNPQNGNVVFDDQVYGTISISNEELDDLIIARTDGTPTYNLTVVVDDWDMQITHVIRGEDHISNTPRQINILKALEAEIPVYAHLPMILGSDGKRLSKRHGAVSVLAYQEAGILPQALLNYLLRLGWSHGDQEIFSLEEMQQLFNLDAVNKSSAAFDQEKLLWLNQHYMKTLPAKAVAEALSWQFEQAKIDSENGPSLAEVVAAQATRCKTLKEMMNKSRFWFESDVSYEQEAAAQHLTLATKPALTSFGQQLKNLSEWTTESIKALIKPLLAELDIKMPQLAQPVRVAVSGNTTTPSLDITLALLGREQTLIRLERAIDYIESTNSRSALSN